MFKASINIIKDFLGLSMQGKLNNKSLINFPMHKGLYIDKSDR